MKFYPIVALLMASVVAVKITADPAEPKKEKPSDDPLEEAFKTFDKSGEHITRQDWKASVASNVKKIEEEKFKDEEEGKDQEEKIDSAAKNERMKENKEKWRKSQFNRADGLYDKAKPQKIEDKEEAVFSDDLKTALEKDISSKAGDRKEE